METKKLEMVIQRNDSRFVATELGDELVIMDVDNGCYIRLNKTARVIWEQLKEPTKADQLVDILLTKYKVEGEQCKAEVMDCLLEMGKNQIVVRL